MLRTLSDVRDEKFFKSLEVVFAPMEELVDSADSKSASERSAGSNPARGTISKHRIRNRLEFSELIWCFEMVTTKMR